MTLRNCPLSLVTSSRGVTPGLSRPVSSTNMRDPSGPGPTIVLVNGAGRPFTGGAAPQ